MHIIARKIHLILQLLRLKIIGRDFHPNLDFFAPVVFGGGALGSTYAEINPIWLRLVLIDLLILVSLIIEN